MEGKPKEWTVNEEEVGSCCIKRLASKFNFEGSYVSNMLMEERVNFFFVRKKAPAAMPEQIERQNCTGGEESAGISCLPHPQDIW